jgi:DNA-binding protein HU-beta
LRHYSVSGIFPCRPGEREWKRSLGRKTNTSKSDAQRFFDAFTEVVTDSLKSGEQVQITGFGKFYVQEREARQGINPQTKQRINIAASKVPKFTAGNALKDQIK